jgi:hypothetical protein
MNRRPHGSMYVQPYGTQATALHACAKDGDFKRPHPPIIGGDIRWDWWFACGRTWVWRTCGVCAWVK